MCTVTIYRHDDRLLVTMNRDEARDRGPERPASVHETRDGTRWAAPLDSDKGGTWIAVNEHGLAAAILNRYQDDDPARLPARPESRGRIIPALTQADSLDAARAMLREGQMPLSVYPPFTLVLATREKARRFDWHGFDPLEEMELPAPWAMVTSSFFQPERVLPWRGSAFEAWLAGGATFERGIPGFHLLQPKGLETIAPMMSRDISSTRSISQAMVNGADGTCAIRHAAVTGNQPDWDQLGVWLRLARAPKGNAADFP